MFEDRFPPSSHARIKATAIAARSDIYQSGYHWYWAHHIRDWHWRDDKRPRLAALCWSNRAAYMRELVHRWSRMISRRIGAPGLEPGTSRSQSGRATWLRHTPIALRVRHDPGPRYGPVMEILAVLVAKREQAFEPLHAATQRGTVSRMLYLDTPIAEQVFWLDGTVLCAKSQAQWNVLARLVDGYWAIADAAHEQSEHETWNGRFARRFANDARLAAYNESAQ